jgi:hypothetical protein
MATIQEKLSGNIFTRIREWKKNRKKNPDWARVEEPETILRDAQIVIYGIVITAFLVLAAWTVMIASPVQWIARFLSSLHSPLPFDQLYASFGISVIVLINVFVTVVWVMFGQASHDDIVEMISDMDSNTQERIVELENSVNEKLEAIHRNE